jgi:hypothetical protein
MRRASAHASTPKNIEARVVERLQILVDHFTKDGKVPRVELVTGHAPSASSLHAQGKAIDFRIVGVPSEAVLAYCHTLSDVGCGLYSPVDDVASSDTVRTGRTSARAAHPKSADGTFVHMDVRPSGSGKLAWVEGHSVRSPEVVSVLGGSAIMGKGAAARDTASRKASHLETEAHAGLGLPANLPSHDVPSP